MEVAGEHEAVTGMTSKMEIAACNRGLISLQDEITTANLIFLVSNRNYYATLLLTGQKVGRMRSPAR